MSSAGSARGGTFTVKNCVDAESRYAAPAYSGGSRVEAKRCTDSSSIGVMQLNGRGGHTNKNEYGAWLWSARSGSGIIAATINARLRNSGGWAAQLFAINAYGNPYLFGSDSGGAQYHSYGFERSRVGNDGAQKVIAQLKCYPNGGCDLGALGGATNRVDAITLTILDSEDPNAWATGSLVSDSGAWKRGSKKVEIHATDAGSGIAGWGIKLDNGPIKNLDSQNCAGNRGGFSVAVNPCATSANADFTVDTSAMSDGLHDVHLCAHDYGTDPNWDCSSPHAVRVDNDDPLQPSELEVVGGEEVWHPDRDFSLRWSNPSQDAAPLSKVHYRVRNGSGGEVDRASLPGSPEQLDVQVPGTPGEYTVEVWLEDAAGNQGAATTATLRFDDVRPQAAEPVAVEGWLSRTELPHLQEIGRPGEPRPVSGISGYAVSIDRSPGSDPCVAEDRCEAAEVNLNGGLEANVVEVADLPEGTNHVHSVAVSGSGMKSVQAGHTTLRVDKTDPVTQLSGAPSGWSSEAVALTATSSDALSGMEPGAGKEPPFTAIRVDGGPPVAAAGDSVTTAVVAEGVHTVDHYARDLAGNVNDGGATGEASHAPPTRTIARIDRSAPEIAFAGSQDPDDPELIVARVSDPLSGTDTSRGTIAMRRAGSAEPFQALPTTASDSTLRSRWDSDSYPAGEYEFRATAYDEAGNSLTSSRRAGGGSMVLPNPLKTPTALRAGLGGRKLVRRKCRRAPRGRARCKRVVVRGFNQRPLARRVRYGRGAQISGRLSAGLGTALAEMPIRVVERFQAGARPRSRVTTVKTGEGGVFTVRLAPGPTRTVEAHFPGTRTLTRAASKPVRLRVRGVLHLRIRPRTAVIGGRPVVFHGRVPSRGAAIPPDGKSVQLQYRLPGLPWEEFRTVQTNRRGAFTYRYRFTDAESRGVRFFFRAFAPRQSGWPYAPGPSNPVAVLAR